MYSLRSVLLVLFSNLTVANNRLIYYIYLSALIIFLLQKTSTHILKMHKIDNQIKTILYNTSSNDVSRGV
jgi:hypothetical protein